MGFPGWGATVDHSETKGNLRRGQIPRDRMRTHSFDPNQDATRLAQARTCPDVTEFIIGN
ncbi:hypothetical protein A6X21_21470 [Planctopirus hydrillae]|uniref:Uncharacterized protein n=1 Tax=Planctopirus hydrillae TaxID=1841610 RepID=A0A1C3EFQ2_9PLAN|nr:hypothetical protein A6X21_21470 [Planctopirus hydrillae]